MSDVKIRNLEPYVLSKLTEEAKKKKISNINHVVSPGAVEHNVITESKQIHEKKLRKKKQYRDNRREK